MPYEHPPSTNAFLINSPASLPPIPPPLFTPARPFTTAVAEEAEDDKADEGGVLRWFQDMPATTAIPMAGLAGAAMIANDTLQIDAEMQVALLFVGFIGTCYTQFGEMAGKALDATADEILVQQNAAEAADIAALGVLKELHAKQTTVQGDLSAVFETTHTLMDDLVVAKSNKLQHDVRAQIVRMLDTLVVQEGNVQREVQSALVEHAVAHVQSLATSKGMKVSALDEALQIIADPTKGAGEDAIGGLFQDYFTGFNGRLEAARTEEMTLDADVVADIEVNAAQQIARDGLDGITFTAPKTVTIGSF